MKKIKLAVIALEENYLELLANRLRREKDITLLQSIIIKDYEIDMKQFVAFVEQMINQPPDILLFDQATLRDSAALDLERILGYRHQLPNVKTIIVGERYNEENVMAMMQGGVQGFFKIALSDVHLIKCIRVVARGEFWLDAELTKRIFEEVIKEFKAGKLTPVDSADVEGHS